MVIEICNYKEDQWFYYDSEETDDPEDQTCEQKIYEEKDSIMEQFLEDCQENVWINKEKTEDKIRELLNTRISPLNIRQQIDDIFLEIYSLGTLSADQVEERLGEKYNIELIDDLDQGKIPFLELEKLLDMMELGQPSSQKKPKREYE